MGRWLGGVYGNTKLATDSQPAITGVYSITDQYYMRREGGWVPPGFELHIQAWGAGGGGGNAGGWANGSPGGSGGYTEARINVPGEYRGTNLLIVTGSGGASQGPSSRAYGGGGCNTRTGGDNRYAGAGGGLAGVFLNYNATAENCLLIAAGGGGGGASRAGHGNSGGGGGGLTGRSGQNSYGPPQYTAGGGTQTAGGVNPHPAPSPRPASELAGQFLGGYCIENSYGGGGGSGWYGGDGGAYLEPNTMSGGGGGSSYIVPATIFPHTGTPVMTSGNTGPDGNGLAPQVGPPNPGNQGRGGSVGGGGDPAFVRVTINDPHNPSPSVVYNYPYTGADQSLTLPSHAT